MQQTPPAQPEIWTRVADFLKEARCKLTVSCRIGSQSLQSSSTGKQIVAEYKMTVIEHIRCIKERQYKQDPMNATHWLLVYRRADGIVLAYDDKHPEQGHTNIVAKHPDYAYITTKGVNSASMAADYARATRTAAKLFEWLRETPDIHIS